MSSSRPSDAPLLPLGCPSCAGGLDPLRDDILFLCPACGAASELVGAATVRRELRHATPASRSLVMHLPFWRLSASAIAPAFNGTRLLTVSRRYSERAPALDAHPGGPAPRALWGGRIGAADAPRIAALAMERALPAPNTYRADAGAQAVLFAIPFYRQPSRLVCAITGLHIYLETIEGNAELLARWEKVQTGS
jgi:predicted RNA-binding Zn-ribbon protein involved in translation (DUF1610 family)